MRVKEGEERVGECEREISRRERVEGERERRREREGEREKE